MTEQNQGGRAPAATPGQGANIDGRPPGPDQLDRADLQHMTSDEIVKAQTEGRLNDLLGVKPTR